MQFFPGKERLLADMLSQATTGSSKNDVNDRVEVHAVGIVSSLITDSTWRMLAEETSRNCELEQIFTNFWMQEERLPAYGSHLKESFHT